MSVFESINSILTAVRLSDFWKGWWCDSSEKLKDACTDTVFKFTDKSLPINYYMLIFREQTKAVSHEFQL